MGARVVSTFGNYLFRQAFSALALILLSLCGVVWIALALKQLKLVTSKGQDVVTMVTMTTLAVPKLLAVIAPIALLIAVIHILSRLNNDSELIVVTASGGSIWRIARPLLLLAAFVAGLVAFVNHIGMPWSLRMLRAKITEVRSNLISQVLLPGRFSTPENGVVIHIRSRGLDGTLYGLLISDHRKKTHMSYLAERGKVVKQDGGSYLVMENGHILRGANDFSPREILAFTSYLIDLERFERRTVGHVWKPQERYLNELIYLEDKALKHERLGRYKSELHERFSGPLYPFLFVLLAVAFVGQAQSTRKNRTQMIAMAFLVAALFRGGGLALNNMVSLNTSLAPLMYLLPTLGIALALWMIVRNEHPRPGLSVGDRMNLALGDLLAWMRSLLSRCSALQPGE